MIINKEAFVLVKKDSLEFKNISCTSENYSRNDYPKGYLKESLQIGKSFDIHNDKKIFSEESKSFKNNFFLNSDASILCIPNVFSYSDYDFHLFLGNGVSFLNKNTCNEKEAMHFCLEELEFEYSKDSDFSSGVLSFDKHLKKELSILFKNAILDSPINILSDKEIDSIISKESISFTMNALESLHIQFEDEEKGLVGMEDFMYSCVLGIYKNENFVYKNSNSLKEYLFEKNLEII